MIRLNKTQLAGKVKFITDYINASNAADGSILDPNSNVATKNIATMSAEINKDVNIQIKRQLIYDKLVEIFGQKQADKYIDQLEKHEIYAHDESGLMPYTYMAQETVLVRYKGKLLNTSFEDLYELVDCNEYLEDEDKNVWCKYPDDLWIKDRKDETKIIRLVKKERHRDLVRVKTKYGEDIFVTDNHPLIISDDKNNTIDTIDSLNKEQYRIKTRITEGNIDKLFVKDFMKKNLTVYENYVCYEPSNYKKVFSHKTINLSEKFGYFIGIFIAEGWYVGSPNQPYDKIMIKMKDKSILNTLCDYLYESTGIYSYVSELSNQRGFYTLQINNQILVNLLLNEFKIYPTAQNKTLPINIYEYNIDFIKGVLAGLIDGDGCVTKTGQFSIRVASRKLISQLQYLLQYLGYSCSTTYQDVTYKETDLIKSSYPVFGIASYVWNDSITLPLCTKLANCEIKTKGKRYYLEEWSNIDSVTLVTNNKLLEANKFIYDITTNSNTFNLNNIWVHNCAAISMYPFLQNGLQDFGGESKAPKHLSSFNGGFINLLFALSSQFCGAVATVEYLMCFDYFARKDYGANYLEGNSKDIVKQELQQVVYALNQPASARGFQSCFWNISIFDKYYFEALFDNFYFPDGSKPEWESLDKLQRFFMKWFNQERTKALLTFPVVTVSVLNDGVDILDTEYRDLISTELSGGNAFFIYTSKSVDSLSSCCFSKDTKILWKSSTLGVNVTTLEQLHDLKWEPNKKNLRIFHNGSWVKGKSVKLPNRPMYKITTSNNKEFIMTDNHINVTYDGEKTTDKLTTDDYLMFNTSVLQSVNEVDEHLTYEMGFTVGTFLGDGSFGAEIKDTIYEVNYSLNKNCYHKCMSIIDTANKQLKGVNDSRLGGVYNNVYPVRISSKGLVAFIQKWTLWHRGTYAYNKTLNLDCLLQSYEFRKGILDGWYEADGGNSNRCYTSSQQLAESMEILITSLGMNSSVNVNDRTDEDVIIRDEVYSRNHPLWCVRWYESCNKRSVKNVYKWKNNSKYFKITSIEKIEYNDEVYCIECTNTDEPYFTLPNGLITHNCRLRNSIADQINDFSYSLGAGGVMTGSINVITLNMNRFVQNILFDEEYDEDKHLGLITSELQKQIRDIHKYQVAVKALFKDFENKGMLPAYTANFISLEKQYRTIGINGLVEAAEYLGYEASNNTKYKNFVSTVLKTISDVNKDSGYPDAKFNTELVPAENLGVKFAKWDNIDKLVVTRDCYNSYLYPVENEELSIIDKFVLHGDETTKYLDGGSALHLNLEDTPTKETCDKLLAIAVKTGCNYFCLNVKVTICNDCNHIDKQTNRSCTKCGSKNIDYATRIIGYLRRVTNFSKERQAEESERYYH